MKKLLRNLGLWLIRMGDYELPVVKRSRTYWIDGNTPLANADKTFLVEQTKLVNGLKPYVYTETQEQGHKKKVTMTIRVLMPDSIQDSTLLVSEAIRKSSQ